MSLIVYGKDKDGLLTKNGRAVSVDELINDLVQIQTSITMARRYSTKQATDRILDMMFFEVAKGD